jgi:hypothetical protein
MHHLDTAATGAIGMSVPLAAAAISLDPMLDFHLRILSMCIGIIVGLASLAKLIYDVWFNTSNHNKK